MDDLRLIIDPPREGSMNMAIDEALLESAANEGIATLRLYQWNEPTLSLGYFQAATDRQTHVPSLDCPLVRRASGGGAILHHRELTYSLALPEKSAGAAASRRLYELVHTTLIAVFGDLGISAQLYSSTQQCDTALGTDEDSPQSFLCFQRRTCFDIVAAGEKIVGSAQRRRRGAILQHGSILLSQSKFAPELAGIEQIAGKAFGPEALINRWPPQLAGKLQLTISQGATSFTEETRAQALVRERFTATDWLYRR